MLNLSRNVDSHRLMTTAVSAPCAIASRVRVSFDTYLVACKLALRTRAYLYRVFFANS